MKSVQVGTRGEGGSEIGDFTAMYFMDASLRNVHLVAAEINAIFAEILTSWKSFMQTLKSIQVILVLRVSGQFLFFL